jgi:hypothetical protein
MDMMIPDLREARLPVWGQNLLSEARRRVRDAEASAREARLKTEPGESSMIMDRYAPVPIGLGVGAHITVILTRDDNSEPTRTIDVYVDDQGTATLRGDSAFGSGGLAVYAESTNVIRVGLTR